MVGTGIGTGIGTCQFRRGSANLIADSKNSAFLTTLVQRNDQYQQLQRKYLRNLGQVWTPDLTGASPERLVVYRSLKSNTTCHTQLKQKMKSTNANGVLATIRAAAVKSSPCETLSRARDGCLENLQEGRGSPTSFARGTRHTTPDGKDTQSNVPLEETDRRSLVVDPGLRSATSGLLGAGQSSDERKRHRLRGRARGNASVPIHAVVTLFGAQAKGGPTFAQKIRKTRARTITKRRKGKQNQENGSVNIDTPQRQSQRLPPGATSENVHPNRQQHDLFPNATQTETSNQPASSPVLNTSRRASITRQVNSARKHCNNISFAETKSRTRRPDNSRCTDTDDTQSE